MFCPNCGTEIKEKKTFCPKCGSPLGVEAVQEDTKTVEAAASTENVHETVIPHLYRNRTKWLSRRIYRYDGAGIAQQLL